MKVERAEVVFEKYAREYAERFMDVSAFDSILGSFADLIPSNGILLDVACGPGNFAAAMLTRIPNARIRGCDLSGTMVQLARENCPNCQFDVADAPMWLKKATSADGIIISFLFPYLTPESCRRMMADCARILEPKGILYISVIEGSEADWGWKKGSKEESLYQRFYSEQDIVGWGKDFGLELLHTHRLLTKMTNGDEVWDLCAILSHSHRIKSN